MLSFSFVFRVLSLSCLVSLLAQAQMPQLNERWRWARFGNESGLPSEEIRRVFESRDGGIWVQTTGGLAWFDGYHWNPVTTPKVPANVIEYTRIAPDSAGILLNYDENLYLVQRDTTVAIPISDGRTTLSSFMAWREPGGAIISLGDMHAYWVEGNRARILESPYDAAQLQGRQAALVENYMIPTRRGLWLKAGPTLSRFVSGKWEDVFHSTDGFLRILHLTENNAGAGIVVLEPVTGDVRIYEWAPGGRLKRLRGEIGDLILSVSAAPDGRFLFLYTSGELRLRENGRWSWLRPLPPPVEQPRILQFGSNGDLWVGGEKGLFVCRLSQERWVSWKEPSPSLSNMVNEIVQARDGALWIGTREGLLIRSPDGRNQWIRELLGTRLGRITAIGEDAEGHMWIGSGAEFQGAFCWDGRTWKHFGQKEGLSAPRIHRIARDRKGRLWFLGLNKGVISGDLADEPGAFVWGGGRFERWGKAEGLLDGRVYAFVEDAKGGYWFGTWTGLSRFRDGKWTYWQAGKGLLGARIWTLAEHPDGRILFSHQYAGLGYVDARDIAHYVSEDEGLAGDEVAEVKVDKRGWIWAATTNGLGCWTGSEWVRFDSHTGLPNDRLWPVLPLDHEVLVGTQGDGVAILQLDSLNTIPPRVRIANPVIEDNNVVLSWTPHAYWGDVPSEDIQTRFRLSGGPWSNWSTQRSIAIRELSAGAYRFEVQAKGPLGETGVAPAACMIEIPPPVYLRPEAIIPIASLCALVIILALFGWVRHLSYNRKIRENEARFRAQYKGNPVPTFTYRKSGNDFFMSDFNDAAEKITLGRSREWLGKRFEELLPNGIDAKVLLEECVNQQATVRRDFRYALDGVSGHADLAVTFAFVPPDLILVHTEDVTARKHNEEILQESREQLRALAARLQSVREEERTLLSREIHDELGQLMTGLKMDLAWIRRRILELGNGLPDVVTQRMAQMNDLLEDAIHTVRKIAGQLRPAILDDLGLIPAIEWQARDFGNRTGIACEINLGVEDLHMDRDRATELFRIYQELLTNIARHAHASKVEVLLYIEEEILNLEVRDDGQGIEEEMVRRPSSLGILGMEERARRVHGTLTLEPCTDGGTLARVCIPLNPKGTV